MSSDEFDLNSLDDDLQRKWGPFNKAVIGVDVDKWNETFREVVENTIGDIIKDLFDKRSSEQKEMLDALRSLNDEVVILRKRIEHLEDGK